MKTIECQVEMSGNALTARLHVGDEITEADSIEIDVPLKAGGTRAQRIPVSQAHKAGLIITGPPAAVDVWSAIVREEARAAADHERYVQTGRV